MNLKFHSPSRFSPDAALSPSPAPPDLGALPEWRLQDLYEGMDSPRFAADLERAEGQAKLFAEAYRGKLAELAGRPDAGETLAVAVKAYELLQDLIGRIMAYASLLYASDTSNPAIAKFYGDAQERVTALAGDLLFFELELNRLDDSKLNAAMAAPALGHYRPWLEDIRKEKPHQLADDLERLFLDKSVSAAAAWNRLFDDTMAALRFDFEGESLTLEPLLGKLRIRTRRSGKRRPTRSPRRSAPTCVSSPHHQYARQGQGDLRSLAQVQGRRRFAPPRQSGRARGRRGAGRGGHGRLSAPLASLLRAESALVRQGAARPLGPQRAAAERAAARLQVGDRARHGARRLWRLFAAHGAISPGASSTKAGSTRR